MAGVTYEVLCQRLDAADGYVWCGCYRDGVADGWFQSTDACRVDVATRSARAAPRCRRPGLGAP